MTQSSDVINGSINLQPYFDFQFIRKYNLTKIHNSNTVKILNIRTPQKFAVITLKFELDGFTKE